MTTTAQKYNPFHEQTTMEKLQEKGHEVANDLKQLPRKANEKFQQLKRDYQARGAQHGARARYNVGTSNSPYRAKPGQPQIGVIIKGYGTPVAMELANECVKQGIIVSNIGLGCKATAQAKEAMKLNDSTEVQVVDCESAEVGHQIDLARDALEKEGADVVVVLDLTQDWRSIETYNRLRIPFVHAGTPEENDERRMHLLTDEAKNSCVISPFISREGAMIELMLETFARSHAGVFRDWSLDMEENLKEGNAVAVGKRRQLNALGYLLDQDVSCLSKCASGKGVLSGTDHKDNPGLLTKLGLAAKDAVSGAKELTAETLGSKSGFTLRSPDGKHSFSISHEHYGAADVKSVIQMTEFLASKVIRQREPRVWGIKDWVPGIDALNREIVEYVRCECDEEHEQLREQREEFGEKRAQFQQEQYHQQQQRTGAAAATIAGKLQHQHQDRNLEKGAQNVADKVERGAKSAAEGIEYAGMKVAHGLDRGGEYAAEGIEKAGTKAEDYRQQKNETTATATSAANTESEKRTEPHSGDGFHA